MIELEVLRRVMERQCCQWSSQDAFPKGYLFYKDKYTIQELIYEGDNGFVYRAKNNYSNQQVIIKELFPRGIIEYEGTALSFKRNEKSGAVELTQFSEKNFQTYEKLIRRFLREVEHLKKMTANTYSVRAQESFEAYNTAYIILDYIDYPTLGQVMGSDEKLTANQVFEIYQQLLEAVSTLHGCGIIHRDLKPSNIYILPDHVVIGDFGISKKESEIIRSSTVAYSEDFASPEQKSANQTQGYWSDIYSLGKILEYLILSLGYREERHSQNQAFYAGLQQMEEIIHKDVLIDVLRKATQQKYQERYQKVEELSDGLTKNQRKEKSKSLKWNRGNRVFMMVYTLVLILGTVLIYHNLLKEKYDIGNKVQLQDTEKVQGIQEVIAVKKVDEDEIEEIEEIEVLKEPLTFITEEGVSYEWNKPMEVKWENPYGLENYSISITDTKKWTLEIPLITVEGREVDLNRFGLVPSDYYIMVFSPIGETRVQPFLKKLDFKVEMTEEDVMLPPIELPYDQFVYNVDENLQIPYVKVPEADSYKATIMNIRHYEDYEEVELDQAPHYFNELVNKPGQYMVNLSYRKKGQQAKISKNFISIPEQNALKPMAFKQKNNCVVTKAEGNVFTWDPLEDAVKIQIKLHHIATGDVFEATLEGDATSIDIIKLEPIVGTYKIQGSYYKDNKKAALAEMYFSFID